MKLNTLPKKNIKFSTKLHLYCFSPEDRKKYIKASKENKVSFLLPLVENGNITSQQMVDILTNLK